MPFFVYGRSPGFTRTYDVTTLVWYELHATREAALVRERQLKKWNRAWKLASIARLNPEWQDLSGEVMA